ncbi:unnamed protein product [Rotaria socialis]|uniref:Uncharacterized protein n=1 Tax=Rotaria socialis TaxID=392032 RepID=A0A817YIN8_9BILA|nr:unnamed protein product [Rotaria socialis]CAF4836128.1 unnamed protein product [Rotaria socialis]
MEATDPKNKNYQSDVDGILDPENETPIEDDIKTFHDKIREKVDGCHQLQKQWYDRATTEEKKQRAKREYSDKGEHVINKSIIELEDGIIKEIMGKKDYQISDRDLERAGKILKESLAPNRTTEYERAKQFIEDTTATYTYTDFYYDTNGALYKAFLLLLRQCARNYFWCIYCKEDNEQRKRCKLALKTTIRFMIENQIFVDKLAFETFMSQTTSKGKAEAANRYEDARKMVQGKLYYLEKSLENAAQKLLEC